MLPLFDVWEPYVVKGSRDQQIIEKINDRSVLGEIHAAANTEEYPKKLATGFKLDK